MPETDTANIEQNGAASGSLRVLVVDPDTSYLNLCREAFSNRHFDLSLTDDWKRALALIPLRNPEVVVCAYLMAGKDGIEFLEELKTSHPKIARIMVTGVNSLALANQAYERAGVFKVLLKPHSMVSLRESIVSAHAYSELTAASMLKWEQVSARLGHREEELRRSKVVLEHILNAVPAGVMGSDSHGNVNLVNRAALALMGRSRDEIEGRCAATLGFPCAGCLASGAQSKQNPKVIGFTDTEARDKTLFWSCEPLFGDEGEPGGCIAAFQDISDKKLLEEKVFLAKQEIEAIFDSITDPTFMIDGDFTIKRANHAFLKLSGLTYKEALGAKCSTALKGAVDLCDRCPAVEVLKVGKPRTSNMRSESGKFYRVNYFPITLQGGVTGAVVRYHDITVEKEMEAKLIHSEKMAAVGQLVAGVAHEINNPTAFVLSNLNRLKEYTSDINVFGKGVSGIVGDVAASGIDPAEGWKRFFECWQKADLGFICGDAEEVVSESLEGVERIRRIVSDLKVFSHRGGNDFEDGDVNKILESTLNIVWNELKYKCDVVKELSPLPPISCNIQQLGQVFMNILVNASQAIAERGTITIATRPRDDGIEVTISDTGSGITEENQAKIFEPFFTTKPVGEGLGLGLHLSARFVRAHGGTIRARSEVGVGTTFEILLPLRPPDNAGEDGAEGV